MAKTPRSQALFLAAALLFFWSHGASADPSKLAPNVGYGYGEIETARSGGIAGAVRSVGSSTTGLFANPATMAMSKVYHLEGIVNIWPEAVRQTYGVGAVDSVGSSTGLAGGIGAAYSIQDPQGVDRKATDVRIGVAYPISDKFFVGITPKYLRLEQNGQGPFGPSLASGGLANEAIVNSWSFDAGLGLRLGDSFTLGVLGTNLTNPGHSFAPTSAGGGLGFSTRELSISADFVADFDTYQATKTRAMVGGEFLAGGHIPIRAGYRFDDGQKNHSISGGLGYLDRSFGVNVAYRRTLDKEASSTIFFGVQFFVESTGLTRDPTMPSGGYF